MSERFSEIRLNPRISFGARSSSGWRTIVTPLEDGSEDRDRRWAHSRKRFVIGYDLREPGVTASLMALHEAMAGSHIGFRLKDHDDHSTGAPGAAIAATDQRLGMGDGHGRAFQLVKTYRAGFRSYTRPIYKPRPLPSPVVAVDGIAVERWSLDLTSGMLSLADPPAVGAVVTAGFEFDVPVRFESDRLEIEWISPGARGATDIVLVEDRRWKSDAGEATWLFSDLWNDGRGGNPLHQLVNVDLAESFG